MTLIPVLAAPISHPPAAVHPSPGFSADRRADMLQEISQTFAPTKYRHLVIFCHLIGLEHRTTMSMIMMAQLDRPPVTALGYWSGCWHTVDEAEFGAVRKTVDELAAQLWPANLWPSGR